MQLYDVTSVVNDIALEVRNFKRNKNGKSWAWSCLVCGDSSTDRRKARFGVAWKDGLAVCNCFNCGYSNTFTSYLKHYHPHLYERVTVNSFQRTKNSLYDLNHLINTTSSRVLAHIFYIDKFKDAKEWLTYLKDKKISLEEKNVRELYLIHKLYWSK